MEFRTKRDFNIFIKKLGPSIGVGSQGIVFFNKKDGMVYKIFHQYFDGNGEDNIIYGEDELLKFNGISNDLYIWNSDVIRVNGKIVGCTSKFINSKSLYQINPLLVDLDKLVDSIEKSQNSIKTISDKGVLSFDVMYNVLYGNSGLKVIDTSEYTYSNIDSKTLYSMNSHNINYEILAFLIDGYLDEFVKSNKYLFDMYRSTEVLEFIKELRKHLSVVCDTDINSLINGKKCFNKMKTRSKYIRDL